MPVLVLIVYEDVPFLGVVALVACHRGDDACAGEVLGRPAYFLIGSPVASRQAGENYRIEMTDRLEQFHRVVHQRQRKIEVGRLGQLLPKAPKSMPLFVGAWWQSENDRGALVEI